jgi:DNA replication protein DnaC
MMISTQRQNENSLVKTCPYCGKEYRREEIKFLDNVRVMYVATCNCEENIKRKKYLKKKGLELRKKIRYIKDCGIGKRFKDKNFGNYEKEDNYKAWSICLDYARNFIENMENGRGLFLYGSVGTGKTHLAVSIIDYIARMHKRQIVPEVIFTTSINMLTNIKNGYDDNRAGDICGYYEDSDLLVVDDLGSEKVTDWVNELFYRIIDNRYTGLKPVIITTNYSIRELKDKLSERFVSRVFEMCRGLRFEGDDYRIKGRG